LYKKQKRQASKQTNKRANKEAIISSTENKSVHVTGIKATSIKKQSRRSRRYRFRWCRRKVFQEDALN